jgi:hypothetical protein
MGEGAGRIVAEGAADPVANIDGAERSCRMRQSGKTQLQQNRSGK